MVVSKSAFFFTFWPPSEPPGGRQEELFGPEGACTTPSGGHKGDPRGAESSSRVGETHVFLANHQKHTVKPPF